MSRTFRPIPTLGLITLVAAVASAQGVIPSRDALERPEGSRLGGTLRGDATSGFRFVPDDGSPPIPIDGPAEIALGGKGPAASAGVPPVQVVLGWNQRVSGTLDGLDARAIRLSDGPGGRPVTIERSGALGLRQRPGEALVLIDGFESIDPARWSHVGQPRVEAETRLAGERSLRLDADGSAITAKLAEPVPHGRLELAYHDTAEAVAGATWFVDLLFRGEGGPETIRAVLGWSEDSLGVSSSGGPVLAVQRLAAEAGLASAGGPLRPRRGRVLRRRRRAGPRQGADGAVDRGQAGDVSQREPAPATGRGACRRASSGPDHFRLHLGRGRPRPGRGPARRGGPGLRRHPQGRRSGRLPRRARPVVYAAVVAGLVDPFPPRGASLATGGGPALPARMAIGAGGRPPRSRPGRGRPDARRCRRLHPRDALRRHARHPA